MDTCEKQLKIARRDQALAHGGGILIVDDDEDICELLRIHLTQEGYSVAVANNGFAAFDEFDRQPADMILLDLNMPCIDGMSVISYFRDHFPKLDLPIVVITACN